MLHVINSSNRIPLLYSLFSIVISDLVSEWGIMIHANESYRIDNSAIEHRSEGIGKRHGPSDSMNHTNANVTIANTYTHSPGMPHTPGISYVNGVGYLDVGTGKHFKIQTTYMNVLHFFFFAKIKHVSSNIHPMCLFYFSFSNFGKKRHKANKL